VERPPRGRLHARIGRHGLTLKRDFTEPGLWAAATLAALAAIAFDVPAWLRGPAPYPPEWQWLRREGSGTGPIAPALFVAAGLVGLAALTGTARARRAPRRSAVATVAAAVLLGVLFQVAVLKIEPEGALPAVMNQTVYRTATSYLTVAASDEARDPLAFVRRHHELLPELRKTGKHASTHPPGGVLYFRALLAAFERSPRVTRAVLEAAGFDEVNPRRPRPQHTSPARAAALAGGLLIGLLCALTAWPIAVMAARAGCEMLAAARLAVLWTLLPGPVLMTPMLDQALCLPVAAASACLAGAALAPAPRAWRLAAWAGVFGGAAVFLSYGAPAFLAFGGLAALALAGATRDGVHRAAVLAAIAAAVTAALWLLPAVLGHHPLASLTTALAIHRDEYTRPRRYPLWLFFNLVDLAVFLGVPVALAWTMRTARSLRGGDGEPAGRLRVATAAALAVLVLSGLTRGEVGRIWLPLMPVLLVAALAWRSGPSRSEAVVCGACLATLTLAMAVFWQVP
jgi:hypothetical protein